MLVVFSVLIMSTREKLVLVVCYMWYSKDVRCAAVRQFMDITVVATSKLPVRIQHCVASGVPSVQFQFLQSRLAPS